MIQHIPGNQRWRRGRASYRPPREVIDPRRFGVEVISEAAAKRYITENHYSRSMPPARLCVGLMRTTRAACRPELVGAAVFSVPITGAVISRWTGVEPAAGVELGRFCLDDSVEGNGESYCLARAFRILAAELPEVHAIVSFSDPMQRVTATGQIAMPGHVGTCYQSTGARHVGRSRPRTLLFDTEGRVVSERALTKLRNDETGAKYAYAQLTAAGAPRRRMGESARDYVDRATKEGPFRRVKHECGHLCWPRLRWLSS